MNDFFSQYDSDEAIVRSELMQRRAYSEEIASKKLEVLGKTYFIDLKLSVRGKFVKISERSNGKKSTIMIDAEYFSELITSLRGLLTYDRTQILPETEEYPRELHSELLETLGRTYFVDLKLGSKGVFLKLSERSNNRKNTVMVAGEDLDAFVEALEDIRKEIDSH